MQVSKGRYFIEIIYRPIFWGVGAALLAWIGFTETEILPAFLVGFCVGFVHDLYLVSVGAMAYKPRVQGIAYHNRFVEAMNLFEQGHWQDTLSILEEILEIDPLAKEPLFFAIRCAEKLERWKVVSEYSKRYLEQYPDDWEIQDRLELARAHMKDDAANQTSRI